MVQTDKTLHSHEIVEIKHTERERERESYRDSNSNLKKREQKLRRIKE